MPSGSAQMTTAYPRQSSRWGPMPGFHGPEARSIPSARACGWDDGRHIGLDAAGHIGCGVIGTSIVHVGVRHAAEPEMCEKSRAYRRERVLSAQSPPGATVHIPFTHVREQVRSSARGPRRSRAICIAGGIAQSRHTAHSAQRAGAPEPSLGWAAFMQLADLDESGQKQQARGLVA
jgi:hypothetical protein